MTRKVVIDTDPGIDDAVAILFALASPAFDVLGITTVAGNIGLTTVTRNAGRILALAGRQDIPVIAGAAAPLARKGFDTAEIHGDDGLGGVSFPEPDPTAPLWEGAPRWIAETLLRHPFGSVDILALGPLTNIARLVREHPAAAGRIRRVIAMGGAIDERGNIGPRSEFNLAADPEAADIVLRAGLPLVLVPLDVTRKVRATRDYLALLRRSERPPARVSADLIDAYFQSTTGGESRPLHDPCVMLFAERPDLFGIERYPLSVDLGDGVDAGALIKDEGRGAPVDVAMRVDTAAALDLLAGRLAGR
ncbi:MAG: nucleoside hydrolase [Mesorhizobium sp.]|nr:nucleoside hydrolase [Mesorhizobium sp.]